MKNKDTAALEVMSELKNYNKFVQTLMKKHIRKGSVLDFGCGFGDFAKHLNDSGYKCDGVELDKEANLESQKKGVKTFYFLNEIKKLYPVVVSLNVLEHIEDDIKKVCDIIENIYLTKSDEKQIIYVNTKEESKKYKNELYNQ